MIVIPLLAVPKSESDTDRHEPDWGNQQNQNASTDRTLPVLGGSGGIAVTHGASLRERGSSPKCKQQGSAGKAQLHLAPTPR